MIERREFFATAAGCVLGLALLDPVAALAADDPYLQTVNPELRDLARAILAMGRDEAPLSMATLGARRAGMTRFGRPPRKDVPVEKRVIAGVTGQPDVTVYLVNATTGGARPMIVNTHGGGFVMGDAMGDVAGLQDICAALDAVAISIEYRLAPETTWRGSLEDNYTALKWLHANAASVGGDPARIALLGGSAGGGHAALLAIAARDRGEVPVAFQCLIYPMLDDRTGSTVTPPPQVGHIIWTAPDNRFGWQCFLGREPGLANAPAGGVPARTASLAGLPPAFIGVGSIDLFCDEDVEYARRLNDAGVPAELIVVPGAFHGFDMAAVMDPKNRIAAWFNAARLDALRRGLGIAAAA
ncbi:MAG: alpha/beta hydrolase fold domain-containing protein [Sphingomonadales bacterium]|nr:alpha/beta hydrolase fold domain-containing protein [Sphingomonadales bacterium]